ncbi:MAG: hypothetical protein JXB48_22250, partial [Candidatus Latescibacteria bacterium]|nr:hypothetical protein [Candidatus Latescibacterota bacterium]
PPWIIDALDSALDSPDGVLAIYAAECIGCLKLDLFTDKLAEKFASAPRTMNQHSIWFRLTVIQTLQNFDSLKVRRVLPLLLTSYSEFCILDPDFSKLLELTMHYGDKQSVKELDRFEKQAKINIERLKKEILNERYNGKIFDQFLEAEEKIIKTKKIINAVG